MKQVRFDRFGPPSVVAHCADVNEVGDPSPWELVVDIEAFPINVSDLAILSGRYGMLPKLPSTVGVEGVGVVSKAGKSVRNVSEGERVLVLANNNWAEQKKVAHAAVHRIDRPIDPVQASMLKVNPATAWMMLHRFVDLKPGDLVIQNAPMSSVGQCVNQLAKRLGFRTINIVRNSATKPNIMSLGGTHVVENSENAEEEIRGLIGNANVPLAFDAVGGIATNLLAASLSPGGQVINYGMLSNEPCQISPDHTIFRGITLKGFWLSKTLNRLTVQERGELFGGLVDAMGDGDLSVQVDSVYPIDDVQDALRRAEQEGRSGKVVMTTRHYQGGSS